MCSLWVKDCGSGPARRRGNCAGGNVRWRRGLPTVTHFTQYFDAQPGNPLFGKAMANSPAGSFEYDVANDQLPTVSWLLPPAGFDEHPNASPAAGATYVAAKIDANRGEPRGLGQDRRQNSMKPLVG